MKKILGAIAITAAALATTAAFAGTAADNKRADGAKLQSQDKAVTESRTTSSATIFTGITSVLRFETVGPWYGNYRAGRVHPPAGR
jgi:hypothetical protein